MSREPLAPIISSKKELEPSRPPTQDNLDAVVEMKFPGDDYSRLHKKQDKEIAGPNASAMLLTPEECGCGKKREAPQEVPVPSTASDSADELDSFSQRTRSLLNGLPVPGLPAGLPPPANIPFAP